MKKKLSRVLIVGRPNVGKSSLFNRLVKRKQALVINQPGVTRDILKQKVTWWGVDFEVWDSGGLWSPVSSMTRGISQLIDKKVGQAMQEADLLLFVMSAREGYLSEDKSLFQLIRKSHKPFLVLVNKVDDFRKRHVLLSEFHTLGVDPIMPCAFEKDRGVSEIVEWIMDRVSTKLSSEKTHFLSSPSGDKEVDNQRSLLVMGKANVGKSSLCNVLLKRDRMLVSHVKGTTMDVVEDEFRHTGFSYVLKDTAGFRKEGEHKKGILGLAQLKSQKSVKEGGVILLLIAAPDGPGRATARLLELCIKEHKAVIIVVNKWDLMKNKNVKKKEYRQNIQNKFPFYPDLPIVFTSALKAQGLGDLLKSIDYVYKKLYFRVPTAELNRFLFSMTRTTPSPVYGVQNVKFYYFTQSKHVPPTFIAFANYPEGVKNSYRRFLVRRIQKQWNLKGIPLRILVWPRKVNGH